MQGPRATTTTLRRPARDHPRENRSENPAEPPPRRRGAALSIGLCAAIVAASVQEPRVLMIGLRSGRFPAGRELVGPGDPDAAEALPSGPLEAEHRTLEIGLRSWVERQTGQRLGYVEQLYTFGDRDRAMGDGSLALPALVVAYLALAREARPADSTDAEWQSWYRYFPWEDWRHGKPLLLEPLEARLADWAAASGGEPERRLREERLGLAFGRHGASWNEELVLERYELLYEAGLVAEAARDLGREAGSIGGTTPGGARRTRSWRPVRRFRHPEGEDRQGYRGRRGQCEEGRAVPEIVDDHTGGEPAQRRTDPMDRGDRTLG